MSDKSYQQGIVDGISLWGEACGRQGNCENCPIGSIRGTGMTCQEFARQFPAKMASILKEMKDKQITYYEEYCLRFPMCSQPVEVVAEMACRKAIFEGYVTCDSSDCVACWNTKYTGDVTVVNNDDSSAGLTSL